jgi:hypothetical protein
MTKKGTCHCESVTAKAWQSRWQGVQEIVELVSGRSSEPFAPLVILTLNEVKGKNLPAQDRLREGTATEESPLRFLPTVRTQSFGSPG